MATVGFGDFEWDEDKARSNVEKHGVTFEEATSVFLDPDYLATDDPSGPSRYIALGFSRLARILFVVHVERAQRVRIISARRATRSERQTYDGRRHNPG
ncbi:MAG: BrnT family toxin [Polyangiaceae bacterium]